MMFIEIIGNLGSDPEQRFTADSKSMASVRVAVNSRRKDANGDQVERTDWFRARMGGGRADYVVRELRKGSRVLVRGRLEIGEWTTREGEKRMSFDIWADDIVNLSSRGDDGSHGQDSQGSTSSPAPNNRATQQPVAAGPRRAPGQNGDTTELEDLPF